MSRSTRNRIVVVAILTFILILAVVQQIVPKRTVTLEVSGEAGRQVQAFFVVDGESRETKAELPSQFTFECSKISYRIVPEEYDDQNHIEVKSFTDPEHAALCISPAVKGSIACPSLLSLAPGNSGMIAGMTESEVKDLQ